VSNETFFSYRGFRWLWANAALVIVLTVIYYWHDPIGVPNGGTWYGYTLGGIATAGILFLMWYGIRKRSYFSSSTTLKGCLSAHVWHGLALALIVPLHAGFQFGWNVHTLAYLVMMLVIASGVWGAINYGHLAPDIQSHRGGGTVKNLVEQIHIAEQNIDALSSSRSDRFVAFQRSLDMPFAPKFWPMITGAAGGGSALDAAKVGTLIADLPPEETDDAVKLVKLIDRKRALVGQVQREVRTVALLKMWLYLHLPLSFALLAALAVHIFSVFFFRG